MKYLYLFITLLFSTISDTQDVEKIESEGVITEITIHQGKKVRETALVKFKLENGKEQIGTVELYRIPFIGSMKSVGDKLTITYQKNNPVILETVFGKFISTYGMYFLILLGIIFSLKPILKYKKNANSNV